MEKEFIIKGIAFLGNDVNPQDVLDEMIELFQDRHGTFFGSIVEVDQPEKVDDKEQ